MGRPSEPLRAEHRELLPELDRLRVTAELLGRSPSADAGAEALGEVVRFLTQHLLPHAEAEDMVLYPLVARLLGAPEATASMSRDHLEVAAVAEHLQALHQQAVAGPLTPDAAEEARRTLYGLEAILRLHFAKEEELYLPLFDAQLTVEEAAGVFEHMHDAARLVRHGAAA